MAIARLSALAATVASAVLMTGCVVAPADGVYYGDAYSTYSTGYGYGYGSGYSYGGYPYYGGSSLVIESSPTYVYGGGRPYYRPGGYYHNRPDYRPGGGYNRPPAQSNRPSYVSPSTGSHIGRPSPSVPQGGGRGSSSGGRFGASQWQR